MPTYTYIPRYKLLARPIEIGDRIVFKRGPYTGQVHYFLGFDNAGAPITKLPGHTPIRHCYRGKFISRIFVPIRQPEIR